MIYVNVTFVDLDFLSFLCVEVAKMAASLASYGVQRGDRVLIYMPMIPEAVVAMLAVVRLGAIHSLVFGGEFFYCYLKKIIFNYINYNLINL